MSQLLIPSLNIYTGNRIETLSLEIAKVLSTPLESPFDPEIILVQSHGMARWLSMELAVHHGICAHHKFYYPNEYINEILQTVRSEKTPDSQYIPAIMTWKIMNLLPLFLDEPGFEPLKKYLQQDDMQIKTYQLAIRIADLFDQYLLFRPEMIFKWERGEGAHWQAQLWRGLVQNQTDDHRAALLYQFKTLAEKSPEEISGLHKRISVFGISALPRFHMDVFSILSGFMEVNLFLVNPCRQYWGVIQSDREIKKKTPDGSAEVEWLYLEQGNRLLASLGMLGRDFFDLLNDFQYNIIERFDPVKEISLLTWIQSDILNLRDRSMEEDSPVEIDSQDKSVIIHSCHSPMREVEVLHDQLLSMFETDPDITPRDILVMAPDIEAYAPYINAVFLHASDPKTRIPYSIADRSMIGESLAVNTLFLIFKLHKSRFKASDVLKVFESPLVLKKFNILQEDAGLIRQWVTDTGIRWGQDINDHIRLHLPEFRENTWSAGIERLLLGYAMAGQEEHMYADILPYDHIEGNESLVLGKFLSFTDCLFSFIDSLDTSRTLTEWSEHLLAFLEVFFIQDDESERELYELRSAISNLSDIQQKAEFTRNTPFSLVEHHLNSDLSGKGFGSGFITGGVTFCAMLPMRSIPFKAICLLGMNHDAYPRQNKSSEFDLIAKNPRPGDRSRRLDDQYIFLESILCARKRLYISYLGQSIRDNSEMPPSVLVSELLDYIENGFSVLNMKITDRLVVKHRLQPFHAAYFNVKESAVNVLFSYSSEFCHGAENLLCPRFTDQRFFEQDLPEPDQNWRDINLSDLYLFFTNPSKYLITQRLGVYIEEGRGDIEDRESFTLSPLDQYNLAQNLLAMELSDRKSDDYFNAVRASGNLPHGAVGSCIFNSLKESVSAFAGNTKTFLDQDPLLSPTFRLNIGKFSISGTISPIYTQGHIIFRYAQTRAKDFLKIWLNHLILSLIKPDSFSGKSTLIGLDGRTPKDRVWKAWEIFSVDSAPQHLENMLKYYWEGLIRPLKFFPETSYLYAQQVIHNNQDHKTALFRAKSRYDGTMYHSGECDDFYYQLCFNGESPIDEEFANISLTAFQPIHDHFKEII